MIESLLSLLDGLTHWQIDLLVAGLLLQGAVVAVFPEEVIFLVLGLLWDAGKISPGEAILAAQIGLLPANLAWVFLGAKAGSPLLRRAPFRWIIRDEARARAERWVCAHGWRVVVATRFIPVVRAPVYFAAGASGMDWRRFFFADWAASCVQIPLLLLLGRGVARSRHGGPSPDPVALAVLLLAMLILARVLGRRRPDCSAA